MDDDKRMRRLLDRVLWAVQVPLAAFFFALGLAKLFVPLESLPAALAWTAEVPLGLLKLNGLAEVLGAVGLIAPAALRIAPRLTPLAAAGLALIMAMAMGFRLAREELYVWPVNAGLAAASALVAWGRAFWAPILSRREHREVSRLRHAMAISAQA